MPDAEDYQDDDEPQPRIAWHRKRSSPAPRWLRELRRTSEEEDDDA